MPRHHSPIAALLAAMLLTAACGPSPDHEPAPRDASVPTPLRAEAVSRATSAPTATFAPSSAVRGDGGQAQGADDPDGGLVSPNADPLAMAPDAFALVDQFNPDTGAGDGWIGDYSISVRLPPEGCIPVDGGPAHGDFAVGASLLDASGEVACGAFGETVVVNGAAFVFGTSGDDILDAARIPAGVPSLVLGFEGNDVITFPGGAMVLAYGGAGDDTMSGGDAGNMLMGGPGNDNLTGGAGHDFIAGGDGDDTVVAGDGEDELYGEEGADTVSACESDLAWDHLWGGAGMDAFAITFMADIAQDSIDDALDAEPIKRCEAMAPQP